MANGLGSPHARREHRDSRPLQKTPDVAAGESSSAAVFLDRDGVIVDLVPDSASGTNESPYRPADVRLVPGAVEGLHDLRSAGLTLLVASNQPAAAKGRLSMAELQAVHQRAVALLHDEGIKLNGWRYCFHHPQGVVDGLAGECACRKPKPGLLLASAAEHGIDLARSWMVGDATTDVEAGQRAGCATVLLENPGSAHRRLSRGRRPDYAAVDLLAAVGVICSTVR